MKKNIYKVSKEKAGEYSMNDAIKDVRNRAEELAKTPAVADKLRQMKEKGCSHEKAQLWLINLSISSLCGK